MGRGGVVGLEDAVALVEADGDDDGEEAGDENEDLAVAGYGAEHVEGGGACVGRMVIVEGVDDVGLVVWWWERSEFYDGCCWCH